MRGKGADEGEIGWGLKVGKAFGNGGQAGAERCVYCVDATIYRSLKM